MPYFEIRIAIDPDGSVYWAVFKGSKQISMNDLSKEDKQYISDKIAENVSYLK